MTTPSGDSLRRVRVRLTTWYAATFAVILLVIGTGMFATITWRYDRELDESLRDTAHEVMRVLAVRGRADQLFGQSEFRIADRLLFVTSTSPARAAIEKVAISAAYRSSISTSSAAATATTESPPGSRTASA
jgi:hypothetical protein